MRKLILDNPIPEVMTLSQYLTKQNCYILLNKDLPNKCILIDPGFGYKSIKENLVRENLIPVAICLTHGHVDHIASINRLIRDYDIKIFGIKNLQDFVSNPKRHLGTKLVSILDNIVEVENDQIIQLLGYKIKFIPTPGHTNDSCFIKINELNLIFTGDTLFKEDIGYVKFPTCSISDMNKTIKKINKMQGNPIIFPGHNGWTTLDHEKAYNRFLIQGKIK